MNLKYNTRYRLNFYSSRIKSNLHRGTCYLYTIDKKNKRVLFPQSELNYTVD